ncbi:ATP-dependent helicase [Yimella sp. NH-Cas1]|uniref:UvrD-helicase domain-containing protein n=1 Tax=Yimella sp. NH-Cas1 TaxID=2917726 RepID=UPI001EFA5C69|nr:ATP-dependent helicase [Yimella sp. NH-Cas1]MCG8656427.1 ATP-dependent helicase [Yimella sp. NH-Cas1]
MRVDPASWRPQGIDDLEGAAWAALRAGTASVTAGPGAGKTEFLAQRAGYLLETGICRPPQQILAISFKRDAAANIRRRVEARLPEHASRFTSMTFDAFTKSILDRFTRLLPQEWAFEERYKIGFASRTEIEAFLSDIAASAPSGLQSDVYSISAFTFLPNVVGAAELPSQPSEQAPPTTAREYAVQQWWARHYLGRANPVLDFVMLNRLAELMIRSSPQLQRALQATYPFVFIDEFQDTTYAQYSFLKSVFAGHGTTVTAVGDRKQRIMGWAGALSDAFTQFEHDFAAEPFALVSNFRSTQRLVDLQHRFAKRLDPESQHQKSQVAPAVGESPIEVWSCATAEREAQAIAAWIASDIEQSGRQPSEFALIARQKVGDLEPALTEALQAVGLKLRNDDAEVGKLRLLDLLKDDLVHLLVGIVRLAAIRGGHPQTWQDVTDLLGRVASPTRHREVGTQLEDDLSAFLSELRSWFAEMPLESGAGPDLSEQITQALTDKLAAFVNLDSAGSKRIFGDRPEDIQVTLDAFKIRVAHVLRRVDSWDAVADAFSDADAVPSSRSIEARASNTTRCSSSAWTATNGGPTPATPSSPR